MNKKEKAWKQEALIVALDQVIVGWANYHIPF
ncbi:MAG: group II intron maturase-specific domain-containing protein [Methanosarcinaceae archaeon]